MSLEPWQLVRFAFRSPAGGWGMLFGVQTPDGWVYTDVTAFNTTGAWSPEEAAGAWTVVDAEYRRNLEGYRNRGGKWRERLESAERVERRAEKLITDGRRRRAEQQSGLDAYARARQVETERQIDNPRDLAAGTVVESPGGDRYVARGFTERGDLRLGPFLGPPDQEGVYPADRPLKGFRVLGTEDELRPVLIEDPEELAGGECSLAVANACAADLPVIRIGLPYGNQGRLLDEVMQLGAPTLLSVGSMFRGPRGEVTSTGFPTFQGFTPVGAAAWMTDAALDSAGFTAMLAGGYRWTPGDYVDFVVTNRGDGEMPFPWAWWSSMDYCVEPQIAKDREEVQRRMKLTAETYGHILDHLNYWRREGVTDVPDPMPILQGRLPEDYAWSAKALAKEINQHHECSCPYGGDCEAEWHREHAGLPALVGLGSVCRRNVHGPDGLLAVLEALDKVLAPHVRLHLFGVKGDALNHIDRYKHRVHSIDSMAWDEAAKRSVQKARKAAGVIDVKSGEPGWISNTTENRAAHMRDWYEKQQRKVQTPTPAPALAYFADPEQPVGTVITHSASVVGSMPADDVPAWHAFRFPGGKVMTIEPHQDTWLVTTSNPSTNEQTTHGYDSYLGAVQAFEAATGLRVPAVQWVHVQDVRDRQRRANAFDAHVLRGGAPELTRFRAAVGWDRAVRQIAGAGDWELQGHPFVDRQSTVSVDRQPTAGEAVGMSALDQARDYVRHAASLKGYASEVTLRRSLRDVLAGLPAAGLQDRLNLVVRDDGRVVPVLLFSVGEKLPAEVMRWAHSGLVLFQARAVPATYAVGPAKTRRQPVPLTAEQVQAGLRKIVKGANVGSITLERHLDTLLAMPDRTEEVPWDSRPKWDYRAETREAHNAELAVWSQRYDVARGAQATWMAERRKRAAAKLGVELPEDANARLAREAEHGFLAPQKATHGWTCTGCFGAYAVERTSGNLVHHGYRRPGVGYIIGDCPGVGFEPWERGLGRVRLVLTGQLDRSQRLVTALREGWRELTVRSNRPLMDPKTRAQMSHPITGKPLWECDTIQPDDPRWSQAEAQQREATQWALWRLWEPAFQGIPWLRAAIRDWQPSKEHPVGPPEPDVRPEDYVGRPTEAQWGNPSGE